MSDLSPKGDRCWQASLSHPIFSRWGRRLLGSCIEGIFQVLQRDSKWFSIWMRFNMVECGLSVQILGCYVHGRPLPPLLQAEKTVSSSFLPIDVICFPSPRLFALSRWRGRDVATPTAQVVAVRRLGCSQGHLQSLSGGPMPEWCRLPGARLVVAEKENSRGRCTSHG